MEQERSSYSVMRSASIWASVVAISAVVVGAGIYSVRLIQYGFSAREKPTDLVLSLLPLSWGICLYRFRISLAADARLRRRNYGSQIAVAHHLQSVFVVPLR